MQVAADAYILNKDPPQTVEASQLQILQWKYVVTLCVSNKLCEVKLNAFLLVCGCNIFSLTLRLLMSYIYIYIYGAPILDVSRSHTTTQHSR